MATKLPTTQTVRNWLSIILALVAIGGWIWTTAWWGRGIEAGIARNQGAIGAHVERTHVGASDLLELELKQMEHQLEIRERLVRIESLLK